MPSDSTLPAHWLLFPPGAGSPENGSIVESYPVRGTAGRGASPSHRPRLESPLNAIAYFEIQSDEPEAAARFYGDVFGWRITREQEMPVPYWRIETDGIRGGLLQRPARTPPPECGTNAFVCSVEVADIDATARTIETLGGRVALPKFAVPGVCWHAYFLDPWGNTFGLFQPDSRAG